MEFTFKSDELNLEAPITTKNVCIVIWGNVLETYFESEDPDLTAVGPHCLPLYFH